MKMNNLNSSFPDQGMVHSVDIVPSIVLKSSFVLVNPHYDFENYFNYYPRQTPLFTNVVMKPVHKYIKPHKIHLPL